MPGRPPAAGPADRAHVTPASQSPGARRSARRRRGLLRTTTQAEQLGTRGLPSRVPHSQGSEGSVGGARPTAQTLEHESGFLSGRGTSAALERGPSGRPGAEPGRVPDAAAGTAAVGAGRPRKWGCHWESCLRTGGRDDSRQGRRGGGREPRVAKGSRLLRARGALGCAAEAGRRRPPRHSLTKSDGPARGPTVLRGPGGPAGILEEWRRGRGTSCLGPRPGPLPEGFEAAGSRASSPSRLGSQRPPPYSPARWGSALPAALRSSAGSKPPRPPSPQV